MLFTGNANPQLAEKIAKDLSQQLGDAETVKRGILLAHGIGEDAGQVHHIGEVGECVRTIEVEDGSVEPLTSSMISGRKKSLNIFSETMQAMSSDTG